MFIWNYSLIFYLFAGLLYLFIYLSIFLFTGYLIVYLLYTVLSICLSFHWFIYLLTHLYIYFKYL